MVTLFLNSAPPGRLRLAPVVLLALVAGCGRATPPLGELASPKSSRDSAPDSKSFIAEVATQIRPVGQAEQLPDDGTRESITAPVVAPADEQQVAPRIIANNTDSEAAEVVAEKVAADQSVPAEPLQLAAAPQPEVAAAPAFPPGVPIPSGVDAAASTFAYPAGEAGTLLRQRLTTNPARALPPLAPASAPRAARAERTVPIPDITLPTVELTPARSHIQKSEQQGPAILRPLEDVPTLLARPDSHPGSPQLSVAPLIAVSGADPAAPPKLALQGNFKVFAADPADDATSEPMFKWLLLPLGPVRTTPATLPTQSIPDPRETQRALPRRPTIGEIAPTPGSNQPLPSRVLP